MQAKKDKYMNVTFEDKALEELFLSGRTESKKYARLPKDVVKRYMATHPGELVRDEMRERGLTQRQLAAMAGLNPSIVSEVVRGKRSVTEEIATSLEKALGIPMVMWMNLQSQYDHDTATIEAKQERVVLTIPTSDRNLLRDLSRRFGWACML